MKISNVVFKGNDNSNTYQLALDFNGGKAIVKVLRNFKGDEARQDGIPSGWYLEDVVDQTSLCIDGGQKWFVYPTKAAWEDLKKISVKIKINKKLK